MDQSDCLAQRFEQHRSRLTALAFRMLGSRGEADDAVQEAWIRLSRADAGAIDNLGSWLTTVVSRVCLNILQVRRAHPEVPLGGGDASTEPVAEASIEADPEHEVLLAESVGLALLVVLDTLTAPERVAFVLHDMFGVSFDEIAPIIGRSAAAGRQLASRARRRIRREDAGPESARVRQAELIEAFLAASRDGDFDGLMALLDPDVVLRADPTAVAIGTEPETRGATAVAQFSRYARGATRALLAGNAALVWIAGGQLRVVYRFTTSDERITGIDLIADPERLRELDLVIADG